MIDKSPAVWTYPDGRERITKTKAGRELREQRWGIAWERCGGICCLCDGQVKLWQATLEHKTSKGAGGSKHDDRQSNLGISHRAGNQAKGSLSLEQYRKLPIEVRRRNCQLTREA